MTWGKLVNGVKYMLLMNKNEFKKKSLEDYVYFTLRDIFANAESADTIMRANNFSSHLTNNVYYEDRTEKFDYSNVLYDKDYLQKLCKWLKNFNVHYFEFIELVEDEELAMDQYMNFDDWWIQFEELKDMIQKQYEKLEIWEQEIIDQD